MTKLTPAEAAMLLSDCAEEYWHQAYKEEEVLYRHNGLDVFDEGGYQDFDELAEASQE